VGRIMREGGGGVKGQRGKLVLILFLLPPGIGAGPEVSSSRNRSLFDPGRNSLLSNTLVWFSAYHHLLDVDTFLKSCGSAAVPLLDLAPLLLSRAASSLGCSMNGRASAYSLLGRFVPPVACLEAADVALLQTKEHPRPVSCPSSVAEQRRLKSARADREPQSRKKST